MASTPKNLGKYLADSREAGTPWNAILTDLDVASAIPLRVPLREFLLSLDPAKASKKYPREYAKVAPLPKVSDAAIVALRDREGAGFPLIAARTGLSVKDVIAAYARGGGVSATGRVYVGAAGATLVTPEGATRIDAPAKKGKKGKKGKKNAR